MKVLMVMLVDARRKCRREGHMMQNNEDDANGDACTTNQTNTLV